MSSYPKIGRLFSLSRSENGAALIECKIIEYGIDQSGGRLRCDDCWYVRGESTTDHHGEADFLQPYTQAHVKYVMSFNLLEYADLNQKSVEVKCPDSETYMTLLKGRSRKLVCTLSWSPFC